MRCLPGTSLKLDHWFRRCASFGAGLRIVPDMIELATNRASLENLDGIPVIRLRDSALSPLEQAEKRLLDVVMSATVLLLLSPLMLLVALAVRIDSPGPILYRARRVGRGGQGFDDVQVQVDGSWSRRSTS